MGQEYSGLIRGELRNSKKIAGYNPAQLKLLREKFVLVCDDDLSIGQESFKDIMRVKEDEARDVGSWVKVGFQAVWYWWFWQDWLLWVYLCDCVARSLEPERKGGSYIWVVWLRQQSGPQQRWAHCPLQMCHLRPSSYELQKNLPHDYGNR